jgi:putative Mg2+ transporter-C (MgtC) family protein
MPEFDDLLFRLLLVVVVGGTIGAEREYRSKSAGFRTMILICLGSFLFTTFGIAISGSTSDRIASNIVTGIGFLGAGVIFKSDNRINGLTTAASIWITAALGMGIADGFYILVLISTTIVLISLFLFTKLENLIDIINQSRTYTIKTPYHEELTGKYEKRFRSYKLRYKRIKQTKSGDLLTGTWLVTGKEKNHNRFVKEILQDKTVNDFEF